MSIKSYGSQKGDIIYFCFINDRGSDRLSDLARVNQLLAAEPDLLTWGLEFCTLLPMASAGSRARHITQTYLSRGPCYCPGITVIKFLLSGGHFWIPDQFHMTGILGIPLKLWLYQMEWTAEFSMPGLFHTTTVAWVLAPNQTKWNKAKTTFPLMVLPPLTAQLHLKKSRMHVFDSEKDSTFVGKYIL